MGDLHIDTEKRTARLRALGYTVIEIWGCDWKKQLRGNEQMASKVSSLKIVTPLAPRDALAGGRTNALKLVADAVPGETVIRYYDFKVTAGKE